jgi:aquaporin Z
MVLHHTVMDGFTPYQIRYNTMKKYLTEGIGTFFLVIAVLLAKGDNAPIAVGAVLIAMIYAGGHISGAHYNPAVSLGMLMRGKFEKSDLPFYVFAQVLASIFAALVAGFLLGCAAPYSVTPRINEPLCALMAEFFGTFVLMFVILNVATARSIQGNSFYGTAIGLAVIGCGYLFGDLSGGAFNPAVALAHTIAGDFAWSDLWIYAVGELMGAAAAASVFAITYGRED